MTRCISSSASDARLSGPRAKRPGGTAPAGERRRMRQRTIHFVSLGCPKNRVDSEVMLGVAVRAGLRHVAHPEDAEIVVVNTCGFVADAKRESIETILRLATLKTQGACRTLVVAGCLSQRYADELAQQLPEVDHFLGSSDILKLEHILGGDSERMLVGSPGARAPTSSWPKAVIAGAPSASSRSSAAVNAHAPPTTWSGRSNSSRPRVSWSSISLRRTRSPMAGISALPSDWRAWWPDWRKPLGSAGFACSTSTPRSSMLR